MARQKNDGRGRLGGRTKGTPDKITTDLKQWINHLLLSNTGRFEECLDALSASEYVQVYLRLINYIVPKQRPAEEQPPSPVDAFLVRVNAPTIEEDLLALADDTNNSTRLIVRSALTAHLNDISPHRREENAIGGNIWCSSRCGGGVAAAGILAASTAKQAKQAKPPSPPPTWTTASSTSVKGR